MFKCNKPCVTCPYVKVGKVAKSTSRKHQVKIHKHYNCHTRNIIYLIECKKCLQQYIGQSHKSVSERFGEHRGYVNNKHLHKATGHHFNQPGHSVSDMTIMIIEQMRRTDRAYREARESMYIRNFGAKWSGLNRKRWLDYLLIAILNFYIPFEYLLSYLLLCVVQLFTADDVKDLHEIYTDRYNSPGELISSVNQWAWRVGIFNNKLFWSLLVRSDQSDLFSQNSSNWLPDLPVKPDNIAEELVECRMGAGVDGDLKQRSEQILNDLLEAGDIVIALVDVKQPGDL